MTLIIHKPGKGPKQETATKRNITNCAIQTDNVVIGPGEIKLEHLNEHQKAKLAYALGLDQCECITSSTVATARDKSLDALQ